VHPPSSPSRKCAKKSVTSICGARRDRRHRGEASRYGDAAALDTGGGHPFSAHGAQTHGAARVEAHRLGRATLDSALIVYEPFPPSPPAPAPTSPTQYRIVTMFPQP
jgi:hypothetical protein